MSNNLTYKLVITDGKEEKYSSVLSYEDIAYFVDRGNIDANDSMELFRYAAQHPSASVRAYVAYKDSITEEIFQILANDSSIKVLRDLVRSDACKKYATLEHLLKYINLDHELAESIAGSIEDYEKAEVDELVKALIAHSDPSVTASLADNYRTPKKTLKTLTKHVDPHVANSAKRSLEN